MKDDFQSIIYCIDEPLQKYDPNYDYDWHNIAIRLYLPVANKVVLCHMSGAFEWFCTKHRVMMMSYIVFKAKDFRGNLDIPKELCRFYTLAGADNSTMSKQQLEKLQLDTGPFLKGYLYREHRRLEYNP